MDEAAEGLQKSLRASASPDSLVDEETKATVKKLETKGFKLLESDTRLSQLEIGLGAGQEQLRASGVSPSTETYQHALICAMRLGRHSEGAAPCPHPRDSTSGPLHATPSFA